MSREIGDYIIGILTGMCLGALLGLSFGKQANQEYILELEKQNITLNRMLEEN